MRKLLVCLLLVSSAYAVENRGDSIKADAWSSVGIPSAGTALITDANSLKWINDGLQLISTNLPAYLKFDSVYASKGVSGYALNSDFDSLEWVLRLVGDSIYLPHEKLGPEEAYAKRQGVTGATDDPVSVEDPRYYWTFGSRMFVYPAYAQTFGQIDTLLIAYYAVSPSLTALTDTTVIDKKYLPMLVDYLCGRIKEAQSDLTWAAWYYSKIPFMTFKTAKP